MTREEYLRVFNSIMYYIDSNIDSISRKKYNSDRVLNRNKELKERKKEILEVEESINRLTAEVNNLKSISNISITNSTIDLSKVLERVIEREDKEDKKDNKRKEYSNDSVYSVSFKNRALKYPRIRIEKIISGIDRNIEYFK
ncbi:hypothetical protein NEOKW01_1976 [Nematocida sp. AWRm80]|nr:hypothetical protein NEOKW01_1976 [Nematocida sp. AWRm80]